VREQILAGTANLGCRQWQSAHPDQVHAWVSANLRYRTPPNPKTPKRRSKFCLQVNSFRE